ncbi:MAG: SRPBCC family protein [Micrococcales bacterium]
MLKPYQISVTETIKAPIGVIFNTMNDFSQFNSWNPFVDMDDTLTSSFSQPSVGEGATYEYQAKRIGSGKMTITASYPNSQIDLAMEFFAPAPSKVDVQFKLVHVADAVEVTWIMKGERGLKDQLINKVLKLDNIMHQHFAKGLAKLKANLQA